MSRWAKGRKQGIYKNLCCFVPGLLPNASIPTLKILGFVMNEIDVCFL
jgi:hypothetical protein